jgi:phage terminase large subunit-like protein
VSVKLAKRLVEPTWLSHPIYVQTYGPEVAELAALADFAPYPEQELFLDLLFAIGPDGKSVAFETDLIAPRQVMKTGGILQAEIGWLFVTEQKLIVHSAHELSTTEEAFNDLAALIENTPAFSKRLMPTRGERPGISEGNGRWAIELATGQRVKYKARTKSGGRGLTGWKVVLDEGFALEPSHMGALVPTLTSVPDPQLLIASSAGKESSAVLRDARDRGRAKSDPTQVYIEHGDVDAWSGCRDDECTHAKNAEGCALDDEERWAKIIPGLGSRIAVSTIRSMRRSMPPEEFLREFMVWWDDPPEGADEPSAIDTTQWADLKNTKVPKPAKATLAIDVSPDRKWATVAVAGAGSELEKTLVIVKHSSGTSWVVREVEKLRKKRDITEVVLHPGGQAGALIPDLVAAGIEFTALTTAELGQACAWFQEAVKHGTLEHVGQAVLDAAVSNARTRLTAGETERWDRREAAIDISSLVAASEAAYRWAATSSKPTRDFWGAIG